MFQRRMWQPLSLVMVVTMLLMACTTPAQTPQGAADQADPNGEITTNTGAEPDTIDPHKASFSNEIEQIMSVFEGLMTMDPVTLKPIPGAAAKDPDISADGLKWTVTLRDGLKYSDGSPVTAKDFAYGFTRTCDPATAGDYANVLYVVVGCEAWNNMDLKKSTPAELAAAKAKLGIKATSDKTIEFTLTEPAAYFKAILYMWVGMPARESDVTKGGDKWTEPATYIGNGPFKLTEWKHSEKFVFERNPNYRKPVKLKKWTRVMITEGAVAFAAYRNNELDMVGVGAEDLRTVNADNDLKSQVIDTGAALTQTYGFNVRRAPFDDINVRRAFAKGIDRDAFVRDILGGIGKPANSGFIPPGIPGYDTGDTFQKFDVTEAKKLLTQAGPAATAALKSVKLTYSSSAREKTRAEWFQQQIKVNLGIDVALDPVDPSAYSKLFKLAATEAPQLFRLGWIADFPDQNNWYTAVWAKGGLFSGRTGYANAQFETLTRSGDKEQDAKKRDDTYIQAGRLLSQDAPAVWLYYGAGKRLQKPWLKGVTDSSIDSTLGQFKQDEIYVTKKS